LWDEVGPVVDGDERDVNDNDEESDDDLGFDVDVDVCIDIDVARSAGGGRYSTSRREDRLRGFVIAVSVVDSALLAVAGTASTLTFHLFKLSDTSMFTATFTS